MMIMIGVIGRWSYLERRIGKTNRMRSNAKRIRTQAIPRRLRSASAFLFPCLSRVARFGLGFMCWCLLLPSSFAFPSLRPG
jgi:hypothetical protein